MLTPGTKLTLGKKKEEDEVVLVAIQRVSPEEPEDVKMVDGSSEDDLGTPNVDTGGEPAELGGNQTIGLHEDAVTREYKNLEDDELMDTSKDDIDTSIPQNYCPLPPFTTNKVF